VSDRGRGTRRRTAVEGLRRRRPRSRDSASDRGRGTRRRRPRSRDSASDRGRGTRRRRPRSRDSAASDLSQTAVEGLGVGPRSRDSASDLSQTAVEGLRRRRPRSRDSASDRGRGTRRQTAVEGLGVRPRSRDSASDRGRGTRRRRPRSRDSAASDSVSLVAESRLVQQCPSVGRVPLSPARVKSTQCPQCRPSPQASLPLRSRRGLRCGLQARLVGSVGKQAWLVGLASK
jgi:hypothetical protein